MNSPNELSPGDIRRIDPSQTDTTVASPNPAAVRSDPMRSNNPGRAALSNDAPIPEAVLPPSVASLCDCVLRDVATGKPSAIQPDSGERSEVKR
jgi:hypothetical protein